MTDKLATVKYDTVMLKGLPNKAALVSQKVNLGYFLESMLSLRGDESTKRLAALLAIVETLVGELALVEVKEAVMKYIEGKLTTVHEGKIVPLVPVPNYLDIILFNKIITSYKDSRPVKKIPMEEDNNFVYVVQLFDHFVQENDIPLDSVWVYTYLTTFKKLEISTSEEKKIAYKKALKAYKTEKDAIKMSKLTLVSKYFSTLQAKGQHIKDLL